MSSGADAAALHMRRSRKAHTVISFNDAGLRRLLGDAQSISVHRVKQDWICAVISRLGSSHVSSEKLCYGTRKMPVLPKTLGSTHGLKHVDMARSVMHSYRMQAIAGLVRLVSSGSPERGAKVN